MGVVNVTPDSFSDGGRHLDADRAVECAERMIADDVSIIDIGGESTRPGAAATTAAAELDRVLPVIRRLSGRSVWLSVDTRKASVARAALGAGAHIVNDVGGGRDSELLDVVATFDAGLVLMHMRGEPQSMQHDPQYDDVVAEVGDYLHDQVERACDAGVRREAILVDPGIGFGKTNAHNFALLANVEAIADRAGVPVLIGASRKRSLGVIVGDDELARDDATLAVSVAVFAQGAAAVRVHDVRSSVLAARWIEKVEVAA